MEDHDNSLILVENLLLRRKLESHEATFSQLQQDLKVAQEHVLELEDNPDSGLMASEGLELEIQDRNDTILRLQQELKEMKTLDQDARDKYLEDLEHLQVENLILTQKLSSMQEAHDEMKFTVVKEKEEIQNLQQNKRIDRVRIDALTSIISELDNTVKTQESTIDDKEKTISGLKSFQQHQDSEMETIQEDLELIQVKNLVLNSKLVSHQDQQEVHDQEMEEIKINNDKLKLKTRTDCVRIDAMTSIISELDNTVKTQESILDDKEKTISGLKRQVDHQDSKMDAIQENLELIQVENLVLNSKLVSHQEQQEVHDREMEELNIDHDKLLKLKQKEIEVLEKNQKNMKLVQNEAELQYLTLKDQEEVNFLVYNSKISSYADETKQMKVELFNEKSLKLEVEQERNHLQEQVKELKEEFEKTFWTETIEQEIKNSVDKIEALKDDLERAMKRNHVLDDHCRGLSDHLETLKVNQFLLQSKLCSYQEAENEKSSVEDNDLKENDDLKDHLSSQDQAYFSQDFFSQEKIQALEKTTEDLQKELENSEKQNQELVDRCTDLVFRLESVQEHKETQTDEDFQAKINDLIKAKESLEEDIENIKVENFTVIRDLSEELSQLESQLEVQKVEKAGLSEELTQKITTIKSFQAQISHQESLIARMKAREAEILEQTALKEGLLEQTEKDLVSKICALTSTSVCLTDAQDEIQDMRQKCGEKEEKLEILQVQNRQLQDDLTKLNANMEMKEAEYESNMQSNANQVCVLNSQLLQKDVDIESLRNELEKARLEDRRENEQKISQLEEDLRQKEAEMKEAHDKISCMNDDLETQIMDKMTAEEDNESLKANEKTLKEEIEELKMQKEELNQKLQKASEKETELSQDSEMSREALESLKLEMTSMEVEKNALRTELCGREEELSQLKTNLKESQNAVETKNSQLEELKENYEKSQTENEQKMSEISNLEACTESLKEDLKKTEDEAKKMLERADKDQVTIENLKGKLEAKEAELVQSLDALEQDLSNLSQERDASKKEEIRLQSQIGLLEDKSSCLEKNIEELKIEHEEEKQKYEKKIEETQKKLKAMTEDRDSRIKRTRLLLDIQKKYEKQQNEAYEQYEELKKVSEDLKERVKDRDALELDLIKYKNRTKELENEIENMGNNANSGASGTTSEMPWDIDPELQDMSARELKAILGHDLTAREKIRLNELVVVELEKDLKAAEANETRHIMDITSLKLELKKTTVKLNHLQNQRSMVKAAMKADEDTEGEESKSTKSKSPQTRKSARFQDENASENNAKKPKLMPENETRSTRSRRSRASHLEKGMPDNPFTKTKTKKSSPLKTITNVNKANKA